MQCARWTKAQNSNIFPRFPQYPQPIIFAGQRNIAVKFSAISVTYSHLRCQIKVLPQFPPNNEENAESFPQYPQRILTLDVKEKYFRNFRRTTRKMRKNIRDFRKWILISYWRLITFPQFPPENAEYAEKYPRFPQVNLLTSNKISAISGGKCGKCGNISAISAI